MGRKNGASDFFKKIGNDINKSNNVLAGALNPMTVANALNPMSILEKLNPMSLLEKLNPLNAFSSLGSSIMGFVTPVLYVGGAIMAYKVITIFK